MRRPLGLEERLVLRPLPPAPSGGVGAERSPVSPPRGFALSRPCHEAVGIESVEGGLSSGCCLYVTPRIRADDL